MISEPREAGKHGWRSACHPGYKHSYTFQTFSVSIFPWIARKNGKGTKVGKCVVRVSGPVGLAKHVDNEVQKIIQQLDSNRYGGPKHVRII